MKKSYAIFLMLLCYFEGFSQLEVVNNEYIKLFGTSKSLHTGQTGKHGQASTFDLDQNGSEEGLILEYGASESSGIYMDGQYVVIWSPGDNNRLLRIYDEDAMSSTSTTYEKFYIDGDGDFYKASDYRRKDNIKELDDVLNKIAKLRGVTYTYLLAEEEKTKNKMPKVRYGFIAQELEAVIPEVVDTDEHGNKFVNYTGLIPLLIDGLKLQQTIIETQNEAIEAQAKDIDGILKEIESLKSLIKNKSN